MEKFYAKTPWRTQSKWIDADLRNGCNRKEALKFFKSHANHDFKIKRDDSQFRPIFARKTKSYQMGKLVQAKSNPFLIFINVYSRKAYAYSMKNKSAGEVLDALNKHLEKVGQITELSSDQDTAYLSDIVQKFILENHIDHFTTEEKNYHKLGIINRLIKTLRDLNTERNFFQITGGKNKSPNIMLQDTLAQIKHQIISPKLTR
jgi:transposase InsO family protein